MPVEVFRLGYVPGVTPARWVRTWQERHSLPLELVPLTHPRAAAALAEHLVDAALLRPPVEGSALSAIPLYTEVAVVLAARDHPIAALEKDEPVRAEDLAEEVLLRPLDDVYADTTHLPGTIMDHRPATTADAVQLVAAGTGLLVLPLSLARLYHRRDVVHRPLADGPGAPVLLAWLTENDDDAIEDFIGIVRGRTVNSTRGRRLSTPPAAAPPPSSSSGGRTGARTTPDQGGRRDQGAHRRRPSSARGRHGGPRRRGHR